MEVELVILMRGASRKRARCPRRSAEGSQTTRRDFKGRKTIREEGREWKAKTGASRHGGSVKRFEIARRRKGGDLTRDD